MNLDATRDPRQRAKMKKMQNLNDCPFCRHNLKTLHDAPIEREGTWWSITRNDYPYEGTRVHYLAIAHEHLTHISELTPEAFAELGTLMQELAREHDVDGGALFMRFGNVMKTGATIAHLHVHLIVGASEHSQNPEKLKVTLGYR